MSAEAPIAEGVLEYLITSIVEEPDEVRIETSGEERCTFSVTVADGDMGRVIGRRGRVANAIRTIVRAAAVRDETEIDVDFVD
ncbi:MAG: KH domain-containing protein [Acidimicrobiales bacterium]|nr:KH domain-containing protein [Acidimicrobiales bacterium]